LDLDQEFKLLVKTLKHLMEQPFAIVTHTGHRRNPFQDPVEGRS